MSAASAIYAGAVLHQRLRPLRHRLRYRVYALLLDLDELPALAARLRWLSLNRFNLFSFHERDHGAGHAAGLREWVRGELRSAGIRADGAIRLLTMPRVLGYVFNPLSVYFCHDAREGLRAILYEVNNTFGERHVYLIEVAAADRNAQRLRQRCAKALHVSPFLGLDLSYEFDVAPPAARRARLALAVDALDTSGAVLAARFAGRRRALADRELLRLFFGYPLLTLKVILGIHWEALRLWIKGARVVRKPQQSLPAVTVVTSGSR